MQHSCKKDLTRDPVAGIMAQGNLLILHLGFALAQTCCFEKNLVHTRKKDLTFLAFALILAQGPPNASSSHYYWRPRAEIAKKASDFVENVSCGTFPNQYLQKSLDSFLLVVVVYNVPILAHHALF